MKYEDYEEIFFLSPDVGISVLVVNLMLLLSQTKFSNPFEVITDSIKIANEFNNIFFIVLAITTFKLYIQK